MIVNQAIIVNTRENKYVRKHQPALLTTIHQTILNNHQPFGRERVPWPLETFASLWESERRYPWAPQGITLLETNMEAHYHRRYI